MIDLFSAAKQAMVGVHPVLPWLVFTLAIWAPQWAIRTWRPGIWEKMASLPFIKLANLGPALKLARKAWQAIPSAAAGAILFALMNGGDIETAWIGAVGGLIAPVWHETLKKLPGSYGHSI